MSFVGGDAVELFRITAMRSAIKMHRDCGMIPTRGMTITKMLAAVTAITGKPYKGKTKHDAAIADLDARIAAAKASMPVVHD
jgi:TPP-dependent pyruvate/acetoin dehydrogenase alpha subunit